MEIIEDSWLSCIFEHPVFRIEPSLQSAEQGDNAYIRELVCRHASRQSAAMYYTKVDTNQVDVVRQFILAGLYVVDVNVTFNIDTDCAPDLAMPTERSGCSISEIGPRQYQEVLDIAATCFQYSRFHLDPLIPNGIANRIKHDWILNHIRKERGERLFVASIDGRPVGFLAVVASDSDGKRIRTIDLIGVSNSFQRQGVGRALVGLFICHYKEQCDYLQVGTQVANIPSMRLYQRIGFYVMKTQYVMHMHVRNARRSI